MLFLTLIGIHWIDRQFNNLVIEELDAVFIGVVNVVVGLDWKAIREMVHLCCRRGLVAFEEEM